MERGHAPRSNLMRVPDKWTEFQTIIARSPPAILTEKELQLIFGVYLKLPANNKRAARDGEKILLIERKINQKTGNILFFF